MRSQIKTCEKTGRTTAFYPHYPYIASPLPATPNVKQRGGDTRHADDNVTQTHNKNKLMKAKNILFPLAGLLLAASCMDDAPQDVSVYGAIATAYETGDDDHYFELDNGKRMATTSNVNSNLVSDSDRVYITYTLNDKPVDGYDYNISLQSIDTVLTLKAKVYDTALPDTLGNDPMTIADGYLTDKWLNLQVSMPGYYSAHRLTLAKSAAVPDTDAGMIDVELRHKLDGDNYGFLGEIVSFDISGLKTAYPDKQGIRVKIKDHNANDEYNTYEYVFQAYSEPQITNVRQQRQ